MAITEDSIHMTGEMVDVEAIAKVSHGKYWDTMTDAQREKSKECARDVIAALGFTPAHKNLKTD